MLLSMFLAVLFFSATCAAESFAVPKGWNNPAFTDSRDERMQVAQKSMGLIMQNVSTLSGLNNMATYQSSQVFIAVAMADYISGTQAWRAPVTQTIASLASGPGFTHGVRSANDAILNWMLACIYAYRAYGDPAMLELAESAWATVVPYQITVADARANRTSQRTYTLNSACNGQTIAGGVFNSNGAGSSNDSAVQTIAIGQFLAASAHLAELTANHTYLDAAVLSANFMRNFLVTPTNLIRDGFDIRTCQSGNDMIMNNFGIAIHALSVLAGAAKDTRWRDLWVSSSIVLHVIVLSILKAVNVIIAASQSTFWASPDGILVMDPTLNSNDDTQSDKGYYIRSLYEPWSRNIANSSLSSYIGVYIAVQYNALQNLASNGSSGYYNSIWHGPPIGTWTNAGVMASAGVLAAAIGPSNFSQALPLRPSSALSTSSMPTTLSRTSDTSPTSTGLTASSPPQKGLSSGVIAGVAVAGLIALGTLGLGFFLCRLRRAQSRYSSNNWTSVDSETGTLPIAASGDQTAQAYVPRKRREMEMMSAPTNTALAPEMVQGVPHGQVVQVLYDVQPDGTLRERSDHSDIALPPYVSPFPHPQ